MKRKNSSGQSKFVRYGLRSHNGRTNKTYRGGVRQ